MRIAIISVNDIDNHIVHYYFPGFLCIDFVHIILWYIYKFHHNILAVTIFATALHLKNLKHNLMSQSSFLSNARPHSILLWFIWAYHVMTSSYFILLSYLCLKADLNWTRFSLYLNFILICLMCFFPYQKWLKIV